MVNLSLHSLLSDAPKLDKETSALYCSVVGALLYNGNSGDAACAIRLSAFDLCAANEDSLRRLRKVSAVFVPHKGTRKVLPSW